MTHEQQLELAIAALRDIYAPIDALRKMANEQGAQLDGRAALDYANDPNLLKEKARKALDELGVPLRVTTP